MKTIILAGGSGTRLWPLSRTSYPKQFVKFFGNKSSLFQETFKRSLLISEIDDIYIATNDKYKFLVLDAIEELGYIYKVDNIILEPEAKNTLPAIYACVNEIVKNGHDSLVVFPADHIVMNNKEFSLIIKESEALTKTSIITFGIRPTSPNTGYGYISPGEKKLNGFIVNYFKEKPTLEKANEFIKKGYYWNSGIFMFSSTLFLNEVKKYSPEIFNAFDSCVNIRDAFLKINTNTSIDYGLIEKSDKLAVVPVNIGWSDLGSYDSFYDLFHDSGEGVLSENINIMIDSKNNLIQSYNGKIVATIGIQNSIIIDDKDALLVCKRGESQKVKEVVDLLSDRNDPRKDSCLVDYRPWGHYKIIEEEPAIFKIKKITVNQGEKLSYQLHHHRSEHWIVIKGTAKVTTDNEIRFVRPGESVYLRERQKHRLENPGKMPLEIIEVQMGHYLEEDDIVRFEDEYGRK